MDITILSYSYSNPVFRNDDGKYLFLYDVNRILKEEDIYVDTESDKKFIQSLLTESIYEVKSRNKQNLIDIIPDMSDKIVENLDVGVVGYYNKFLPLIIVDGFSKYYVPVFNLNDYNLIVEELELNISKVTVVNYCKNIHGHIFNYDLFRYIYDSMDSLTLGEYIELSRIVSILSKEGDIDIIAHSLISHYNNYSTQFLIDNKDKIESEFNRLCEGLIYNTHFNPEYNSDLVLEREYHIIADGNGVPFIILGRRVITLGSNIPKNLEGRITLLGCFDTVKDNMNIQTVDDFFGYTVNDYCDITANSELYDNSIWHFSSLSYTSLLLLSNAVDVPGTYLNKQSDNKFYTDLFDVYCM